MGESVPPPLSSAIIKKRQVSLRNFSNTCRLLVYFLFLQSFRKRKPLAEKYAVKSEIIDKKRRVEVLPKAASFEIHPSVPEEIAIAISNSYGETGLQKRHRCINRSLNKICFHTDNFPCY
jgi:hypothetical protein